MISRPSYVLISYSGTFVLEVACCPLGQSSDDCNMCILCDAQLHGLQSALFLPVNCYRRCVEPRGCGLQAPQQLAATYKVVNYDNLTAFGNTFVGLQFYEGRFKSVQVVGTSPVETRRSQHLGMGRSHLAAPLAIGLCPR